MNEQIVENNKPRLYCGNDEQVPEGYAEKGSSYDCLKKGYGAALYNATDEEIEKARQKKRSQLRTFRRDEIEKFANRLNIDTKNKNTKAIYNEIILKLALILNYLNTNEEGNVEIDNREVVELDEE